MQAKKRNLFAIRRCIAWSSSGTAKKWMWSATDGGKHQGSLGVTSDWVTLGGLRDAPGTPASNAIVSLTMRLGRGIRPNMYIPAVSSYIRVLTFITSSFPSNIGLLFINYKETTRRILLLHAQLSFKHVTKVQATNKVKRVTKFVFYNAIGTIASKLSFGPRQSGTLFDIR